MLSLKNKTETIWGKCALKQITIITPDKVQIVIYKKRSQYWTI